MKKEATERTGKPKVTAEKCRHARRMFESGMKIREIAEIIGLSESVISKLKNIGWDVEAYLNKKKEDNRRAASRKTTVELVYDPSIAEEYRREQAEKQLKGQIEMDLTEAKPEMSDQVKMMRFIASQVDKLALKLDHINDTLNQLIRAVRQ